MPAGARTTNTIFRWRQVSFSSCLNCDNWALDNVEIGNQVTFLEANPVADTTGPSATTTVDIEFKSCGLLSGVYEDSILVISNDPLNPLIKVPYSFTVNGAPETTVVTRFL